MKIKGKQGISDNSQEEFNACQNHSKKSFETENDEDSIALKNAKMKLSKISEDDWDYDILKREIEGLERKEKYRKDECDVSGDMWLLRDMLYEGMGVTDLEFTIYFDEFMIITTNMESYIEYKVFLRPACETEIPSLLGTTKMIEYVHIIINYYRTVGDVYDHYK